MRSIDLLVAIALSYAPSSPFLLAGVVHTHGQSAIGRAVDAQPLNTVPGGCWVTLLVDIRALACTECMPRRAAAIRVVGSRNDRASETLLEDEVPAGAAAGPLQLGVKQPGGIEIDRPLR